MVEKRKTPDLSACSAGCGLNLMWKETEVTIIKPEEHGGRDDCVEEPPVVEEFPCNLLACTTDTPPKPKPVPGSFSQQSRQWEIIAPKNLSYMSGPGNGLIAVLVIVLLLLIAALAVLMWWFWKKTQVISNFSITNLIWEPIKRDEKQEETEKEKKMGPWPPAGQGRLRIPSQVRKFIFWMMPWKYVHRLRTWYF